jgi:uncharacterized protein (TIGR03435 family)
MRETGKALVLAMAVSGIAAVSVAQTAQTPAFEVASIKLNTSSAPMMGVDADRGRFVATNVPLTILLRYAFDTRLPQDGLLRGQFLFSSPTALQVIGGPTWITKDRFDIEAKPSEDHLIAQPEMQLMLQSLLEDRFQLKVHREMREVPTYDLVVAKEGKLQASSDDKAPPSTTPQGEKLPPLARGKISTFAIGQPKLPLVHTMYGHAIPISALAITLASWAGRPVTDKTNLNGVFDLVLQFSAPQPTSTVVGQDSPPTDPPGPSIFTTIQQELGLKLESSRGPVEVLVIDSVQRPTEN